MFTQDQPVIIDTALGGIEFGTYKQELKALPNIHEVWVNNEPARSRIVWTRNIEARA